MTYFVGKNEIISLIELKISKVLKILFIKLLVKENIGLLKFLHYLIIFCVYSYFKSF